MKIVSLHRELNTDQIYVYYSYCLKIYKKKKKTLKKENILRKNCQKVNTKNIFMNFEILRLNYYHKFPKAPAFSFY